MEFPPPPSLPPVTMTNSYTYTGLHYAFDASGGFTLDQGFKSIDLASGHPSFYVTDSIQLLFSARTLNNKIGIMKDASNVSVVEALYDKYSDTLLYDNLNICTCDIIDGVNVNSVVSVGRLQYLYSDFTNTVNTYFGNPTYAFASLFSNASDFDINNRVFDADALIQVLNSSKFNMHGSFISDLSGTAKISNINDTLKYSLNYNMFNNRYKAKINDYRSEYENAGILPIHRKESYSLVDGFIAGDLIFIPDGLTITLSLDIGSVVEDFPAYSSVGSSNLDDISDQLNYTYGYIKRSTTWSVTNITQVTQVPILLMLVDKTVQNFANFGIAWQVATNILQNDNTVDNLESTWVAISISTNGKYQTVINEEGNIYISEDYGATRRNSYNIGYSETNSIAISFTGQYQTASNGFSIFISNDYGYNWTQTFSGGTSNIYVSISLTGMYQTLVSSGDTVYTSNDYGNTWNKLDIDVSHVNNQNTLYQSVETFPTAGIDLSYDGKYQTIVSENIYISSDYGVTWINASDPVDGFQDRNWQGVSMSSDGKYQTAIDSGGDVYKSNNYGLNWEIVTHDIMMDKEWISVSLSATGQYQTILETRGSIYISNDYAGTWSIVNDPDLANKDWRSVSISSDALYQCAVEYNGQIYMSQIMDPSANCLCI